MKTHYLSDIEKKAIIAVAGGLSTRASIKTPTVPAASLARADADKDPVSELSDRIDALTRHTNASLSKLTASIDRLHKKTAAIAGQFDAIRQSLAEMQSTFEDERRAASEATSTFIDQLTRDVSSGLDSISSVVDATAEAQHQLISLARRIADGIDADPNPVEGHVL